MSGRKGSEFAVQKVRGNNERGRLKYVVRILLVASNFGWCLTSVIPHANLFAFRAKELNEEHEVK